MITTRKIRWGVLGWARIAREFIIPAIQRSSNSEFTLAETQRNMEVLDRLFAAGKV